MKLKQQRIVFAIILILLVSCKKRGCTDCNAINYAVDAEIENNSCEYVNDDLLGTYKVKDSVLGYSGSQWEHRVYNISIRRSWCSPNNLKIISYADIYSGDVINVDCQISNKNICIYEQKTNILPYDVKFSEGHFSNDSIYFDFKFIAYGDPYIGSCYGKKL